MGVDDVKKESVQAVLAEELLAGRDIESIDWSKADKRGFTVLHCLLSVSILEFIFSLHFSLIVCMQKQLLSVKLKFFNSLQEQQMYSLWYTHMRTTTQQHPPLHHCI